MTTEIAIQHLPLSADEIEAWKLARFICLSVDGTVAMWDTNDAALAERLPGLRDRCPRSSDPGAPMEYTGRSSNPEAIALVRSLRAPKPGPFGRKPGA